MSRTKKMICFGVAALLMLILVSAKLCSTQRSEIREIEKTKWRAFAASHACEIVARDSSNKRHESVTWKCNDGILHTKPAYLEYTL